MDFLNYTGEVEVPGFCKRHLVIALRWGGTGREREGENAPFPYFGAADAAAAKSMNIHASPPYTPTNTHRAMEVSIWKMV